MKRCSKCKSDLPLESFQRNRIKLDGLQTQCRDCMNETNRRSAKKHAESKRARTAKYDREHAEERKAYRAAWRKANAERIKERNAAYREANREAIRAQARDYSERTREERKAKYRANPEPAKARARAYTAANTELVMERNRKWRAENPDRYREHMRMGRARRRARLASLPTYTVTAKDMRRLLASPCAVTGCDRTDIQIDHVIPVARGGSHGVGNFQPLCSSHNQSKGKRTWIEFRVYLALKAQLAA